MSFINNYKWTCSKHDSYEKTCVACQITTRNKNLTLNGRRNKRKQNIALQKETRKKERILKEVKINVESVCEDANRVVGTQNSQKSGSVYVIENKAWPGWVKIGCALNIKRRLSVYQTGDPTRSYNLCHLRQVNDRKLAEQLLIKELVGYENNGEWFKIEISKAITFVEKIVLVNGN
jgi:hypothetical protein